MGENNLNKTIQVNKNELDDRILFLYNKCYEKDEQNNNNNMTIKIYVKEIAYLYEEKIRAGLYPEDVTVEHIFDMVIGKLNAMGFHTSTIDYVTQIFHKDEFMKKYCFQKYDDTDERRKKYADGIIKRMVARRKANEEDFKLLNSLGFNNTYTDIKAVPAAPLGNPRDDKNLLSTNNPDDTQPDNIIDDEETEDFNGNDEDEQEETESDDQQQFFEFDAIKNEMLNPDNEDVQELEKIVVENISKEPVLTPYSEAFRENLEARKRNYEMILYNPIEDVELCKRLAYSIKTETMAINTMNDKKWTRDIYNWILILIEKEEQSIHAASSKSKIPGNKTGGMRGVTREQIAAKPLKILKMCKRMLNSNFSLNSMFFYSNQVLKRNIADFHIKRHNDLSESAFGKTSFMN